MIQNLQDAAKATPGDKFKVIQAKLRKQEKSQQPHLIPKGTRKRTNKTQSQQKERNKDDSRNK